MYRYHSHRYNRPTGNAWVSQPKQDCSVPNPPSHENLFSNKEGYHITFAFGSAKNRINSGSVMTAAHTSACLIIIFCTRLNPSS